MNFRAENDTNDGRWSCHAITPSDNNNTWWWIVRFSSSSALLTSLSPSQIASSIITVRERRSISKVSLGSFFWWEWITYRSSIQFPKREEGNNWKKYRDTECVLVVVVIVLPLRFGGDTAEMKRNCLWNGVPSPLFLSCVLKFQTLFAFFSDQSASPLLFSPFFTVCRVSCDSAQKEEEILILMTTMIFFFLSYNCLSEAVEWRQQSELSSDV